MFGRGILFIAVLAAAILGPYLLTERSAHPEGSAIARWWNSMWTDSIDGLSPLATTTPLPGGSKRSPSWNHNVPGYGNRGAYTPSGQGYGVPSTSPWVPVDSPYGAATQPHAGAAPGIGQRPQFDIGQLIRFDKTPPWVMQNWQQVSTEIWDGDLAGMRVPLISGTNPHDLAGSLTYYFDQQQILQRIAFQGSTSDPRYIQSLAAQLGLQPKATYGGTTMVQGTDDAVTDILRVRPLARWNAMQRYEVLFELNRPGSGREVSKACADLLKACSTLPSLEMPKLPTDIPVKPAR